MYAKGSGKKEIAPLIPLLFILSTLIWFTVENVSAQVPDTTDYFPLNVGDSCFYSNTLPCPPDTAKVRYYPFESQLTTDTVWIDGKKYFVKNRFFLSPDTMRLDLNGNIILRNFGEDRVFYKLNAAVGDTWTFSIRSGQGLTWLFTAILVSRSDSITVHGGQFLRCLRFHFHSGTSEIVDWLAPNVGLVFRCVDEPIELYEAIVKGVRYPKPTSLEEQKANTITQFVLYQNYPNPFNPQTIIRYKMKSSGHTKLEIFNAQGKRIRRLVDRFNAPGSYEVTWDGKDDRGRSVPSAIYICTLGVNGSHLSKKLLLIK